MRKNRLFIVMAFVASGISTSYAGPGLFKPVPRGQKVQDIPLEIRLGDVVSRVNLGDYKGKLIILDFWSITCADCIAGMSHMLELQEQFKDRIQVILVTHDKPNEVKMLWDRLRKTSPNAEKYIYAASHIPNVEGDTALIRMFPHIGNPTHVWIDGDQVYRAITYPNTTTPENITAFLNGEKVKLAVKGTRESIDESSPLSWVDELNGFGDQLQYYSFLLSRIEKGPGTTNPVRITDSVTHKIIGLSIMNRPILDLYKMACFMGRINVSDDQVLLEVKNPGKYYNLRYDENIFNWLDSNTYCYALKLKSSDTNDAFSVMQEDLNRFFHLESAFENRKVKCMILKRISSEDKLRARSGEKSDQDLVLKGSRLKLIIRNEKMKHLLNAVETLVHANKGDRFMPVIDETAYDGNVDIDLPWDEHPENISLNDIHDSLRKYGLDIMKEYRDRRVLVIKEKL